MQVTHHLVEARLRRAVCGRSEQEDVYCIIPVLPFVIAQDISIFADLSQIKSFKTLLHSLHALLGRWYGKFFSYWPQRIHGIE